MDIRNEGSVIFANVGRVYVNKMFKINFDTDYKFIRFTNSYPELKMLMIDIERPEAIPRSDVVKDEHLSPGLAKMKALIDKVESGEILR